MNDRIATGRVIQGVGRRWSLILLLTLLAAGAGYATSLRTDPVYQATGSILVGQPFQAPNPNKDYVEASQQLALTYADVIRRQPVLEDVVRDLKLGIPWEELRDRVQVDVPPNNPQLIIVSVEAGSADQAKAITLAIEEKIISLSPTESDFQAVEEIRAFVTTRLEILEHDIRKRQRQVDRLQGELKGAATDEKVRELELRIERSQRLIIAWQENYSSLLNFQAGEESPNYLQVLETAEVGTSPVRPDISLYTLLGGAVGLLVALGLAYLLEFRRQERLNERVASAQVPERIDPEQGQHADIAFQRQELSHSRPPPPRPPAEPGPVARTPSGSAPRSPAAGEDALAGRETVEREG